MFANKIHGKIMGNVKIIEQNFEKDFNKKGYLYRLKVGIMEGLARGLKMLYHSGHMWIWLPSFPHLEPFPLFSVSIASLPPNDMWPLPLSGITLFPVVTLKTWAHIPTPNCRSQLHLPTSLD